jgi:hypothetical protein
MNFQQCVKAFVQLGQLFSQVLGQKENDIFSKAYVHNNWFTDTNIHSALTAWATLLTPEKLDEWLANYTIPDESPKTVAIIMAGNIPMVGFHDLLCVLITGNKALVKLSTDDTILMKWAIEQLIQIEPAFAAHIEICETRLPQKFDAVIATGSNNTNRYFEYYFRNKKSLLRKNRNSVAVLTGNETQADLVKLGEDVFTYFGLGCRNVSKLYVPEGYDFVPFFEAIESFYDIGNHHKYINNYTYHKAIFLMNLTPHLDNNFVLLKEDEKIASPLGVLFHSSYQQMEELQSFLATHTDDIQCIVSTLDLPKFLPLGKAQHPELWDYADGEDTLKFILAL